MVGNQNNQAAFQSMCAVLAHWEMVGNQNERPRVVYDGEF